MISKYVQINRRNVLSVLVVALILVLTAAPTLANVPLDETGSNDNLALCTGYENVGVLGREGGLLELLGVREHRDPFLAAIVTREDYTLRAAQNGSTSYIIYVRTECLEHEGGIPFSINE